MAGEAEDFVHSKQSVFYSLNQLKNELVVHFGRDGDPDKIRLQSERECMYMDWVKRCESLSRETEAVDTNASTQEQQKVVDEELEDLGTKSDAENSLHAEETDTKEDEDTDAVAACETMLIAPVLDSVSTESELLFQTPEVIDEVIQQSQVPISFLVSRPGDMMSGVYGMDVVVENQNLEIKAVEKKLFDDFHENFCFGYLCKGAE